MSAQQLSLQTETATGLLAEALEFVDRVTMTPCYRRQFSKPGDCAEVGAKEPCRWCRAVDLKARMLELLGEP